MKDFGADVRALKDVKNFLDRMLMILNLSRTSLSEILREMLEKVKHEPEGDIINIDEAMEALYGLKSGMAKMTKWDKPKFKNKAKYKHLFVKQLNRKSEIKVSQARFL